MTCKCKSETKASFGAISMQLAFLAGMAVFIIGLYANVWPLFSSASLSVEDKVDILILMCTGIGVMVMASEAKKDD